jgi:hypothetical protein
LFTNLVRTWRGRALLAAGAFIALVAIANIVNPQPPTTRNTSSSASVPPKRISPIKARTPTVEEKVRDFAKTAVQSTDISGLTYEGVQFSEYGNESYSDGLAITVNYHLNAPPTEDDAAAILATKLFQQFFATDSKIIYVWINFNGPLSDRYGNTFETNYIGYALNRSAFTKINWPNFEPTSICSFLRAENGSELDSEGEPVDENKCALWPSILSLGVERDHR